MSGGQIPRLRPGANYWIPLIAGISIIWAFWALWLAQGEPRNEPPPSPYDQRLLELDRLALDDAYRTHITKLFGVWMGDEHGQPQRAIAGANRARRAYVAVMKEIESRERRGRGE
jgi:hypothetical protein